MATLPLKARKFFKSESDSFSSSDKFKSPRLSLQRFFERSKLRRGFVSNFDIHAEFDEPDSLNLPADDDDASSDEIAGNKNGLDSSDEECFEVAKPRLRRRHSFSTVESMAKTLIEKVGFVQ